MSTKMETAEREDKLLTDLLDIIRFTEGVSAKLHRVMDEAKIYQVVKEEFAKSDRWTASILLLADDGTSLRLAETSIAPSKLEVLEKASGLQVKEYRIELSKSSIYSQVVKEGKTVHANVSDTMREFLPRPLAYLISKTMGYDKKFSTLTPLYRQRRVIGVLAVSCADLCEYFLHSVENLALHISTALELAHEHVQRDRAVQALKRYHTHLGELVEERTGELKTANEKLREEIGERKQAEEALRESREKLQKMFESVTDGISVIDLNGVIIETNQGTVAMHGFASKGELLGRNALELITPRDRERIAANMRKALKQGIIRSVEYTLLKADGTEFAGELSTNVLRDASGKVVAHITIARDITERKKAEEALNLQRAYFQQLFDNSPDAIAWLDTADRFVNVNKGFETLFGYGAEEIKGRFINDTIVPEDRREEASVLSQARFSNKVVRKETVRKRKDGSLVDVSILGYPIRFGNETVGAYAIYTDITERKQAEEALQAEKNKLQSLIDAMEDGLSIQDPDYNIIYQNEPVRKLWGDRIGEKCYRVYEGEEGVCEGCPVEKAFGDGKSHTSERRTVAPSGEVAFWEVTANPIRDAGGRIVSCIEVPRNITERKQAEQALADEATRRRILVDQSRDGIVVLDENGKVYESNRRFAEMLGYTPEEVTQLHVWDWDTQWTREQLLGMVRSVDAVGDHFVTYHRRKDGTVIDVEISTNGAVIAGQKLVFCVCRDITERKQAEKALEESQKFSSSLLESSPNPITVVELDTSTRYVNPAFEKLTGFTLAEIAGRKAPYPWWPEGERSRILAAFKDAIEHGGRRAGSEHNFQKKNGEHFWVALNSAPVIQEGKPVYLILNWLDITERKRAEEKEKQMQQELYLAQRLASVGELAAGVAHEINNPLTGVLGFSQRLMRKSTDEAVSRDLEIIHSEARRAAEVVQNLLTFARRRQPKKEYANINDIVQKTLELRSYALQTSNIEVVTTLTPRLPKVMVDFPQMQEVFLNIILNAEQAMSEAHGRGKLIIKTRRVKDYVRVSFADDGPGVSPENLDKVFDPFFTTREQKGGTGLGLSACHGIVTEHGGRIYARSKPGKGATFLVELPLPPLEAAI